MKFTTRKQLWMTALVACALIGALWLCGATEAFAQEARPAAHSGSKTFWQMFNQGGVMMYVMLLVSIFAMSLIIESAMKLRIKLVAPPELFSQLRTLINQGNY